MGFFAVAVRQTNFVWLLFVMFTSIQRSQVGQRPVTNTTVVGRSFAHSIVLTWKEVLDFFLQLVTQWNWVRTSVPYGLVIAYCVYYVMVINGGAISMGDHSAHVPVFHAVQPMYLGLLVCMFMPITSAKALWRLRGQVSVMNVSLFVCLTAVTVYLIRNYTYVFVRYVKVFF